MNCLYTLQIVEHYSSIYEIELCDDAHNVLWPKGVELCECH